ncbi:hypothetical protein FM103_14410 [Corynebacterium xerosis]|nr:hypothetical protein FM103_14410 [Corynebacterium xerosis]
MPCESVGTGIGGDASLWERASAGTRSDGNVRRWEQGWQTALWSDHMMDGLNVRRWSVAEQDPESLPASPVLERVNGRHSEQ